MRRQRKNRREKNTCRRLLTELINRWEAKDHHPSILAVHSRQCADDFRRTIHILYEYNKKKTKALGTYLYVCVYICILSAV